MRESRGQCSVPAIDRLIPANESLVSHPFDRLWDQSVHLDPLPELVEAVGDEMSIDP